MAQVELAVVQTHTLRKRLPMVIGLITAGVLVSLHSIPRRGPPAKNRIPARGLGDPREQAGQGAQE